MFVQIFLQDSDEAGDEKNLDELERELRERAVKSMKRAKGKVRVIVTILNLVFQFLGGLHVTNPPIRLMCPTSVCPSTFSFPDSNLKMLCPIEFKLDREIEHHHS